VANSDALGKAVRAEFSASEWKRLIANREFNDALERAETISEAGHLISPGALLLNRTRKPKDKPSPPKPET
jgi:hypothetical protein